MKTSRVQIYPLPTIQLLKKKKKRVLPPNIDNIHEIYFYVKGRHGKLGIRNNFSCSISYCNLFKTECSTISTLFPIGRIEIKSISQLISSLFFPSQMISFLKPYYRECMIWSMQVAANWLYDGAGKNKSLSPWELKLGLLHLHHLPSSLVISFFSGISRITSLSSNPMVCAVPLNSFITTNFHTTSGFNFMVLLNLIIYISSIMHFFQHD